ncbi:hypothetical protein T484DRAFT_1825743, partial [Baffinella frigidus]
LLIARPALAILDESTSALDLDNEDPILDESTSALDLDNEDRMYKVALPPSPRHHLLILPDLGIPFTSSLDLDNEDRMYKLLAEIGATVVSVGNRPSLIPFHGCPPPPVGGSPECS